MSIDKKKNEEMKKRLDERTVISILNVCKLYEIDYANLPTSMRKALIGIYGQGAIDALEEVKKL